jgi:hypothetical protein
MIQLRSEPPAILLRKADILAWAHGLSEPEWEKLRPHLRTHKIPGCTKPYYIKSDVYTKLIAPILAAQKP